MWTWADIACRASLCLAVVLLFALPPAQAMTTLRHADATVERGGAQPLAAPNLALPYHWDAMQGGVDGSARFVLRFAVEDPSLPHALYISRVGNTFRITLNGIDVIEKGVAGDAFADFAKQPQFVRLPANALQHDNTLLVSIDAQGGRRGGLSEVIVGEADEVDALYRESFRWRVRGFIPLSTISAVLGGLALILWLRQRESLYMYYAVGELSWALLLSDTLMESAPLPWPWWGVAVFFAYASAAALISKFALILVERHHGWWKRISDWHLYLSLPMVATAMVGRMPMLLSVWLGITLLVTMMAAAIVVITGIRSKEFEKRVLAFAVIVTCAAATRDMIVFRILPGYGGVPWVRYAWVAYGVTLAWIIAERMHKSKQELAQLNLNLRQRLAARESELDATYAQRAQAERDQAMTEERQRLTRDMHDGLGSQLLGALHLAQNPEVPRHVLTEQLRDTLDHLKLTVDAMQDTEGDIPALLGALRYRLGPRLDAAGVQLSWSVEELPPIPGWTLQDSRNIQMILFEAFSNIIAHAGATQAHLRAALDATGEHVCIALNDNGTGFQPGDSRPGGKGLANMQTRAARLGAVLQVASTPEGTEVHLRLPVRSASSA